MLYKKWKKKFNIYIKNCVYLMTNIQTYEEFITGGMKSPSYNPIGKSNRFRSNPPVKLTQRQIPPKHGNVRQIDKINDSIEPKGDPLGNPELHNEPGKGRYSHIPTRVERMKKRLPRVGKHVKNKLIKGFKDFPHIR